MVSLHVDKDDTKEQSHQVRPSLDQQMNPTRSELFNIVSFAFWLRGLICFRGSGTDSLGNKRSSGTV
jgi:hypothetical protein